MKQMSESTSELKENQTHIQTRKPIEGEVLWKRNLLAIIQSRRSARKAILQYPRLRLAFFKDDNVVFVAGEFGVAFAL